MLLLRRGQIHFLLEHPGLELKAGSKNWKEFPSSIHKNFDTKGNDV